MGLLPGANLDLLPDTPEGSPASGKCKEDLVAVTGSGHLAQEMGLLTKKVQLPIRKKGVVAHPTD